MTHDDDAAAIREVLSGEPDAFARIVRRYQRRLLAFGRRFFKNPVDREDFVQDVFLQAFRRLSTFRGEGRFSSWLLALAYHEAVRQRGRSPEYAAVETTVLEDPGDTPEEAVMKEEAKRIVVGAMRELPARYAACIDLFFFFGQTYEEISRATGYPLNTVRSHIRRAKALLFTALSARLPEVCHEVP